MPSRALLVEGSSTSSPDGGVPLAPVTPYHAIYMRDRCDVDRPTRHINFATGGETLSTISGRAAHVIANFGAAPTQNVLTLQLGQNDFVADGPYADKVAEWVADVKALLATYRKGAGRNLLKIGLATQNPRNDATFLGTRAAVNNVIRALVRRGHADFLIDWATDATYGLDDDVNDSGKYPDGCHPSQANQSNMEALYYRPALNALWERLSVPKAESQPRMRSRMGRAFKVGDHVSWNSEAGHVSGIIVAVHTSDLTYRGYVHHASPEEPQYEIHSDKTDHVALHKGRALRHLAR